MNSDKHLHILYLPRWYPCKQDPMLGLFVKKHALAAVKAGYRVSVAYAVPDKELPGGIKYSTEVKQEDAFTEVITAYLNTGGFSSHWRQVAAWKKAIKLCVRQSGRPELVHAHILTRTAVIAALLSLAWRIPYLVTEHWSRYYPENLQYKGWLRKLITRFLLKNAGSVSVVSDRLANAMHKQGLRFDTELLPNVVDTVLFHPAGELIDPYKIISVTCFEERSKNLKMLIDAFTLVHNVMPDARLVLVGEGADLEATIAYVNGKNFQPGTVRFTGMLQDEALAAEIRTSACLALSSNYETFGIVAFEAMASGIPVVATDVADLKPFIGNDFGKIVQQGDSSGFAAALLDVLGHPEKFDRAGMAEAVRQNFSEKMVSDKLDVLYQSVLNKRKHGREQR
ncbi:D-inositol-3-phosphate glycosyltransferase [bioreactor metagenome]|jgi:glycosyltransferase involved in cell wall biosynthesis|uniref:D-inositol-3-phosphate glycosyltransferase n=1 Tax=bioreactor metagenome TaxID=1076179 RepID=A0A644VB96_9ZZZZ|nr:glycosyltransferase [Lentimicrobium sp.]MEA5111375.1 glycosyltransferase [Lentimicrobium sp.]